MKFVTDPESGAWQWREVCGTHEAQVRAAALAAPDPEPNHGGVLLRAFPEYDIDALYRAARETWTPWQSRDLEGLTKPKLRVLMGGAS